MMASMTLVWCARQLNSCYNSLISLQQTMYRIQSNILTSLSNGSDSIIESFSFISSISSFILVSTSTHILVWWFLISSKTQFINSIFADHFCSNTRVKECRHCRNNWRFIWYLKPVGPEVHMVGVNGGPTSVRSV